MIAPRDEARTTQLAEAIYGLILVTSVVAALSEDEAAGAREILGGVVLTTLVFWLAHVYARVVATQLAGGHRLTWLQVRAIMRHQWPIVEAGLPTFVVLALGWIGVISTDTATTLAIALGIASMVGLGFLIARRSGLTPLGTLWSVALSASFGLAILVLKVTVH
jgi:hypothetical protein